MQSFKTFITCKNEYSSKKSFSEKAVYLFLIQIMSSVILFHLLVATHWKVVVNAFMILKGAATVIILKIIYNIKGNGWKMETPHKIDITIIDISIYWCQF